MNFFKQTPLLLLMVVLGGCNTFGENPSINQVSDVAETTLTEAVKSQEESAKTLSTLDQTPPPVQLYEIPPEYVELRYPEYITSSPDGTYYVSEIPSEIIEEVQGAITAEESPTSYYALTINPDLNNVTAIQISFTITKASDHCSNGRNFLVGTLDPSLTYPDKKDGILDEYGDYSLVYTPEFMKLLDRYIQKEDVAEGTYYEIEIPYAQFSSGRTLLILRFVYDVKFRDLRFSTLGLEVDFDKLTQLTHPKSTIPILDIWDQEDVAELKDEFPYANIFLENLQNDGDPVSKFRSDLFLGGDIAKSSFFYSVDALSMHYGAAPIPSVPVVSIDNLEEIPDHPEFAINPDILPEILAAHERIYHRADQPEMVLFWEFIEKELMNLETNLVSGVWADYPVEAQAQPERKTYANLGILSTMLATESDIRVKSNEYLNSIFGKLAEGIARYEIVEINEKYYYAPYGINPDGAITIMADTLGYHGVVFFVFEYLSDELGNQELADRMIRGYANSLQLMLDAQEATPSNLLPEKISVNFQEDGTPRISYEGEFYIGNPFFYFAPAYANITSSKFNDLTTNLPRWLKDTSAASYVSGDTPKEKWQNYETTMRRYDAAHRVLENTYRILYNVYSFQSQDEQYAARYTLEGEAIEFNDAVLSTPSTPGEALGWYQIGRTFQDNHMRGKAQYIVAVGMEEMECYFSKLITDFSDYESLASDRNFFRDNKESTFVKSHLLEISRLYIILLQGPGSENIFPVPFGQHYLSRWKDGNVDQVLDRVRLENIDVFGEP